MSETSIMEPEVKVTESAARQIVRLKQENSIPESHGLRVGVKGGGCSGLTYTLGFDAEPKPADSVIEHNGVKLFVDAKSLFYLMGTELDFSDGLNGRGFTFNNPNAAKTCGCGSSFGV